MLRSRKRYELRIGDRAVDGGQRAHQPNSCWLAALLSVGLLFLVTGCGVDNNKRWELQFFVTNNTDDQNLYIIRGGLATETAEQALAENSYSGIGPGSTQMIPFGDWYDGEDPGCMRDFDQLWLIESPSNTKAFRTNEGGPPRNLIESVPDAEIWLHIGPGECFDTRNQDVEYP